MLASEGVKRKRSHSSSSSAGGIAGASATGSSRFGETSAFAGKRAMRDATRRFVRAEDVALRSVTDKKARARLRTVQSTAREAARKSALVQGLLPAEAGMLEAEGVERTFNMRQAQLAQMVDEATQEKMFDLHLTSGAYSVDTTTNGRFCLLGGQKGHLAMFERSKMRLRCEVHVNERVRDVAFLHNETLFAAAQKRYVYVYDDAGLEVNKLSAHVDPLFLTYLPYHFLLVSVGRAGVLKYADTSTNQLIAEHKTRLGTPTSLSHNPRNAVVALGQANGTVTMWTPNMSDPVVRMLCHRSAVQDAQFSFDGRYMVTSGGERQLCVWDMRTFKKLNSYSCDTVATTLSVSQRGVVAACGGAQVVLWKDVATVGHGSSPYMRHVVAGDSVHDAHFVPYDDLLMIGHSGGVQGVVVPGAGEPNFDTLEANVFETNKQRREAEVHKLLDKLPPATISLDVSAVGKIDQAPADVKAAELKERLSEEEARKLAHKREKRRKQRATRRQARKQQNVIDEKMVTHREEQRQRVEQTQEAMRRQKEADGILGRFRRGL